MAQARNRGGIVPAETMLTGTKGDRDGPKKRKAIECMRFYRTGQQSILAMNMHDPSRKWKSDPKGEVVPSSASVGQAATHSLGSNAAIPVGPEHGAFQLGEPREQVIQSKRVIL